MIASETIEITDEFKDAMEALEVSRKNDFITGRAGAGKSTLLRYFIANTKRSIFLALTFLRIYVGNTSNSQKTTGRGKIRDFLIFFRGLGGIGRRTPTS